MAAPNLSNINPALKNLVRNLPRAAKAYNFQYRVTSGYRSRATQTRLYNDYLSGRSQFPAAPPGTSDHEKGLAIDILTNKTAVLAQLLINSGMSWGGQNDPIHFSLVKRQAVGAPRTGDLGSVNTIPQESFWGSFYKSSRAIVKLASWIPSPIGIAATLADWIL